MAVEKKRDESSRALFYGAGIILFLFLVFAVVYTNISSGGATTTTLRTTIPHITTVPTTTPNTTIPYATQTLHYIPITISNNESFASAPFQQMIIVNSSRYFSYINPGWNNVEFTTGPDGTGSVLQAWVESNATNRAEFTVVWINFPNGIKSGNTRVYMDFMKTAVLSSSGPTGEAPQLGCPNQNSTGSCALYGKYDNGADVFNFYDNFAGSSLNSSKWHSPYPNATYSVLNGISLMPNPREVHGSRPLIYTDSYNFTTGGGIAEFYGAIQNLHPTADINNLGAIGIVNPSNDSQNIAVIGSIGIFPGYFGLITTNSTIIVNLSASLPQISYSAYSIIVPPGNYSATPPSAIFATVGYSPYIQAQSSAGLPSLPQRLGFTDQQYSTGYGPIYWIRTRAYVPAGSMPTVTFGTLT